MNKQPNIVFIFMDDMGWKDLGCTGSSFYETPNIDKLCKEGMQFENAYAACPVCSPSRASFLTGKYPARVGVTDWIDEAGTTHPLKGKVIDAPYLKHLPKDEITIAHLLKQAGYDTWHVGKWHLGSEEYYPEKYGFDVNIGGCSWGHPNQGYFAPYGIKTLEEGPEGEYLTDRLTDEAIKLIKNKSDKPFFLNFCHYAVHAPIQVKEKDYAKFALKAKESGLDKIAAVIESEEFHTEDKKGQHVMRRVIQSDPAYAAMMWNLDENIGRLLQAIEESGEADNTVIIFTSDNGGLSTAEGSPTCNHPAREGKGWMQEGGVRVPLIIKYNKMIVPGSTCDTPVTTPDFFPTFLELAEKDCDNQKRDGVSLIPLMKGQKTPERPLFWHYPHYGNQGGIPGSSVVYGKYKLIESLEDYSVTLYDLEKDLSELTDVSAQNPEVVKQLLGYLHDWQEDVSAKFPTENMQK